MLFITKPFVCAEERFLPVQANRLGFCGIWNLCSTRMCRNSDIIRLTAAGIVLEQHRFTLMLVKSLTIGYDRDKQFAACSSKSSFSVVTIEAVSPPI